MLPSVQSMAYLSKVFLPRHINPWNNIDQLIQEPTELDPIIKEIVESTEEKKTPRKR